MPHVRRSTHIGACQCLHPHIAYASNLFQVGGHIFGSQLGGDKESFRGWEALSMFSRSLTCAGLTRSPSGPEETLCASISQPTENRLQLTRISCLHTCGLFLDHMARFCNKMVAKITRTNFEARKGIPRNWPSQVLGKVRVNLLG